MSIYVGLSLSLFSSLTTNLFLREKQHLRLVTPTPATGRTLQTHTHTDTHIHTPTHTNTRTHPQTHRHTPTHAHTHTITHTDTQTHTHNNTHTHTHTCLFLSQTKRDCAVLPLSSPLTLFLSLHHKLSQSLADYLSTSL